MAHEQPEWVDVLVLTLQGKAAAARGRAKKLDKKKHYALIGNYNTEARAYDVAAQMIEDAWKSEAEVIASLYDKLRTELLVMLVVHTQAAAITDDAETPVRTKEVPITHSDLRILLARFPDKFPGLEDL